MKKSFITLLFMGGIASAASIDLIETSGTTAGETKANGITTAMVFNYDLNTWHFTWQKDALSGQSSITSNAVNLQIGGSADTGKGNYAAVKFEADAPLTLSFDVNRGGVWGGDGSAYTANYHVNVYGFTADGAATLIGSWQDTVVRKAFSSYPASSQTITLAVTGMEDYVSYGVIFDAIETAQGNGGGFGLLFSNVVVNDSSIPEPTTATLSLLALAGLAVRRRRK